jgi:hypothetical protein
MVVDIFENGKESGSHFLPPRDRLGDQFFRKRTAVPVEIGKKVCDVHDDCQSNIRRWLAPQRVRRSVDQEIKSPISRAKMAREMGHPDFTL